VFNIFDFTESNFHFSPYESNVVVIITVHAALARHIWRHSMYRRTTHQVGRIKLGWF